VKIPERRPDHPLGREATRSAAFRIGAYIVSPTANTPNVVTKIAASELRRSGRAVGEQQPGECPDAADDGEQQGARCGARSAFTMTICSAMMTTELTAAAEPDRSARTDLAGLVSPYAGRPLSNWA
jgi:hypothetical protein